MSSEATKEKLCKLYRLMKQGLDGERDNAEAMLTRALEKHGMTLADLDDQETGLIEAVFAYSNKTHRKLLMQICYAVIGTDDIKVYATNKRNKLIVMMTRAHRAEVSVRFGLLSRAFKEESDVFYSAFVMRNNIYPDKTAVTPLKELSPEDRQRALRAAQMAEGINKTQIRKQITGGTDA